MKNEDFNESVIRQLGRCEDTLITKAKEYASEGDRLHNFVQAAHLQGITPAQALAGMMSKHVVSVYDMVMSGEEYSSAMWDEKIGDNLNYLLILRAMIEDASPETAAGREEAARLAKLREQLSSGSIPKENMSSKDIALPGVPLAG